MWTCKELTPDLCDLEVTKGFVTVRGVDVAYWKFHRRNNKTSGHDENSENRLLPIVAIHGGPGWPHDYMLPLQQQACRGRDIYFYDQAGCGESRVPPDGDDETTAAIRKKHPWLFTIEYYAQEELPAIVSHLGLARFHIIGSSWGTVLSQYYALNATNRRGGLASMVLSGPLSDAQLYIESQWDERDGTIGSLPPFVQERIRKLEENQAYDTREYEEINDVLTTKFTCRTAPLPDCFVRSANGANNEIYVGMQGPSEFAIGGVLGDLNITHRLHELGDLPVLLTHGKFDTMRPAVVRAMLEAIPRAERYLLPKSGHVSMIDEPGRMNDAVAGFFDRVESARGSGKPFRPSKQDRESDHHWRQQIRGGGWTVLLAAVLAFIAGRVFGRRKTNSSSSREQYSTLP